MTTRWQRYAGWLVTCAPVFIVLSSARWKLTHNAWYVQEFGRIGWPVSALETLAFFQLTGIVLLLIPWTSVLGAPVLGAESPRSPHESLRNKTQTCRPSAS